MASAIRRPAPPLIQMAGSSSDPCATTNSERGNSIPARMQAAAIAPSMMPLNMSIQTVPKPRVRPRPQVKSETPMLLVAIRLLAIGAMLVSELVQSFFDWMAARIGGLTKKLSSTGFWAVKKKPTTALTQKIPVATRMGRSGLAHEQGPGIEPELGPVS